jgi:hypothetical protein
MAFCNPIFFKIEHYFTAPWQRTDLACRVLMFSGESQESFWLVHRWFRCPLLFSLQTVRTGAILMYSDKFSAGKQIAKWLRFNIDVGMVACAEKSRRYLRK